MLSVTFAAVLVLGAGVFGLARHKALRLATDNREGGEIRLHSRPDYHGAFVLLLALLAGWGVLLAGAVIWSLVERLVLMHQISILSPDTKGLAADLALSDARALAAGTVASKTDALRLALSGYVARLDFLRQWTLGPLALFAAALVAGLGYRRIRPDFRARNHTETILKAILWCSAALAVLTTIGIVLSLIFETLSFFQSLGWRVDKFLFGTTWSPLSGVQSGVMNADKVGVVPLFVGTMLITAIAMLVAVPIGLLAAIYLSDFARPSVRAWGKPMLELLAGVPTVVYGFFAALTVAPFIRNTGEAAGLAVASESALAAGLVMGLMIIPFISSLSDDVINAVPQSLRDGSYGLGATRAETIRQVVLPAALPGIVSAVLLGVSRAVGETMIVVMAAGQGANLTLNPLEAVTTVTVQIVMLITGDTEADTAAGPAFSLGFTLFLVTLVLNIVALRIVRKYRELYD